MKRKDYNIVLSNRDYYKFMNLAFVNGYFRFEASSYDSNNTYISLELDNIDYLIIANILDLI